ncbi:Peptidase SUMO Sentrin Ubl1 protein [Rutstroemia sp. NJR-2017a WRK4]|nr:Peptidase SUMO Sentrin Ubl1 protein [Rutstroemia sp. NJR-2017a WRK4]PQE14935.1 Peptidase SUMO Sentrin Ubl1 protein [Rutstroemia sp. NJR-2017a WRK4]
MEELGCWREAQRADQVAAALVRVRDELSPESADAISPILEHLDATSRLLRDLHDLFPIHRSRVPIINHYLTVILPCLQKTLRDMKAYLDCEDFAPETQWNLIQERLNNQGEMTLVNRFVMYVDYLVQVVRLLSRVPLYDPTILEGLRTKLLRLRLVRGIPGMLLLVLIDSSATKHLIKWMN